MNHLWLEGEAYSYAGDFLCGLQRFVPQSRKHLTVAWGYFRNWQKTLVRKQAFPLPALWLQALMGIAFVRKRFDLATAMLLGFAGLLRTQELILLDRSQLTFLPNGKMTIALWESKGAKRSGRPEIVIIGEKPIVAAVRRYCAGLRPHERIYGSSAQTLHRELRWLAGFLQVPRKLLSVYSLRRGGATQHFLQYQNLAATTQLGRWQDPKTARLYIEPGAAQIAQWQLTGHSQALANRCAAFAQQVLAATQRHAEGSLANVFAKALQRNVRCMLLSILVQ